MAAHHGPSISIPVIIAIVATILFAMSTACDSVSKTKVSAEKDVTHLKTAVLGEWSSLESEIDLATTTASLSPSYSLEDNCPLIYDFQIRWPHRPALATETYGRFEMRAISGISSDQFSIANRATGTYPTHQGERHQGSQFWYSEIEAIEVRLNSSGMIPETSWPEVWTSPRAPLSVAAFFPALSVDESGTGSWSLNAGPGADEYSLSLDLKTDRYVLISTEDENEDHTKIAMIVDATSTAHNSEGGPFFGRYLISARGRVLAAIWAAPSNDADTPAIATMRLTGSCDGVALAPLPL